MEVGSSAGYRVEDYVEKGVKVWGLDADDEAIATARDEGTPVRLVFGDALKLPFGDNFFDRLLSVHLLEHLPNPGKGVAEMRRVLRPGGKAIIVVPCERIRGDTAFAGWWRFKNLHLQRFTPPDMAELLSPYFDICMALFHTLLPGSFRKMPLDRTPLLYYLSQSMLFKLKKL